MSLDLGKLEQQLIRSEGARLKLYQDSVGKWTIGAGRNLSDCGISKDELFYLLRNDIAACVADCRTFSWFDDLNDVRQRAVVELRFMLGPSRLRLFKTTLHNIASGEYLLASANLLRSKMATQVGARAIRLARMIELGTEA